MEGIVLSNDLTVADRLVLKNLADDIIARSSEHNNASSDGTSRESPSSTSSCHDPSEATSPNPAKHRGVSSTASRNIPSPEDERDVAFLKSLNDPKHDSYEPTVFTSVDLRDLKLHPIVDEYLLQPYVRWAKDVARRPTDVVMVTHLFLYFLTSVPSAVYLFWNFTYLHGVLHFVMQFIYMGPYTLMMHQHIHMRGILAPQFAVFDRLFPYITDPLMGHTWNTYFYHHIKHHHVEGNGPNDLSSTLRYQRDSLFDFTCYVLRFMFFIWLELPLYFLRSKRPSMAFRALFCEFASYATYCSLAWFVNWRAAIFGFFLPFALMRLGMMVGNWGQHAFVDPDEPDSDFRSSITLIDVTSNRHCFNDGYHTSHHLNPLRHWRDHPAAFLQQKHTYAKEGALVFHDIDYLMLTIRLLRKDYAHLAKCLVPIGDQISMTMEERIALLRSHTQRFSEEQIKQKFSKAG